MANIYPRYRITVELLDPAPAMQDARLGVYSYDRGRIMGDVWLNEVTRVHSFTFESTDFFIGVGHEAGNFRSSADAINLERSRK
jgi:hypothetical protein